MLIYFGDFPAFWLISEGQRLLSVSLPLFFRWRTPRNHDLFDSQWFTLTSNPDSTHLPSCWPPSVSPDAPLPDCLRTTRGIADGASGHPLPFPCRPWRLQGCLKTGGPTLATDQKLLFLLHQTSLKWSVHLMLTGNSPDRFIYRWFFWRKYGFIAMFDKSIDGCTSPKPMCYDGCWPITWSRFHRCSRVNSTFLVKHGSQGSKSFLDDQSGLKSPIVGPQKTPRNMGL